MITELRLARMKKNLTQKKVAELSGVNRSVLCAIEGRKLVATGAKQEAILAVLGGREADFFDSITGLAI